jgi:CheY-like chemotaxis protein
MRPINAAAHRPRVLVVDDDEDTVNSFATLLGILGHDVRTARNGQTAVGEALAFRPEFILLDLALPGMDGYEVACQIRKQGLHDTVIIAVSGHGREEDFRRSDLSGINHHLLKPTDAKILLTLMSPPQSLAGHPARVYDQMSGGFIGG